MSNAGGRGGGGGGGGGDKKDVRPISCALKAYCDGEDIPADHDTGIKCTNGHTLCSACSAGAVATMLGAEGRDSLFAGKDALTCMVCKAAPLVAETFERQLTEEQVSQYQTWLLMKEPEPGYAPVACPRCPFFAMYPTGAPPALFFCRNEARSVASKSDARPHVAWLSNLPRAATAEEVRAFAAAGGGTITNVDVGAPAPRTSAEPAFAWVAYSTAAQARAAVAALNGRALGGRSVAAALSGAEPDAAKHVMCLAGSCGYCKGTFDVAGAAGGGGGGAGAWQGEGEHGAGRHFECASLGPFKVLIDDACADGASVKCPYAGCGFKARKDGECTHIVCTKCQQRFCYGCGLALAECDGNAGGLFGQHNVDWQTNPRRCPWWLHHIAQDGRTPYHVSAPHFT